MIELFTTRWANKDLAHLNAQPVGISRGVPRFRTPYRYKLARELAPGDVAWSTPDWESFTVAYRGQLEGLGVEAILGRLERISAQSGGLPLVLLCFERDAGDCHRGLLAGWLREQGVEIRELGAGDVAQHEGAAEPTLFGWEDA